ncbi:MAG: hypothetical protein QF907_03865 [Nitrospinota bacterium]|nr:hypothetical protein [Nitrospinota bacterium]
MLVIQTSQHVIPEYSYRESRSHLEVIVQLNPATFICGYPMKAFGYDKQSNLHSSMSDVHSSFVTLQRKRP